MKNYLINILFFKKIFVFILIGILLSKEKIIIKDQLFLVLIVKKIIFLMKKVVIFNKLHNLRRWENQIKINNYKINKNTNNPPNFMLIILKIKIKII